MTLMKANVLDIPSPIFFMSSFLRVRFCLKYCYMRSSLCFLSSSRTTSTLLIWHRTLNSLNDFTEWTQYSLLLYRHMKHNHFRVQANLPWPKFKESQISKPPHKIYILKTQHEATRKKTRAVFFLVFGFRLAETNNKQVNSFSIIHLIGSKQWTMQTSGKPTTTTGLYR